MDTFGAAAGLAMLPLILFGIVLAVTWVVVPFMILSTNRHLREIHAEAHETNKWLKYLAETTHEAALRAGRAQR